MAGAAAAQELMTVAHGEQFSSGPIVRGKASPPPAYGSSHLIEGQEVSAPIISDERPGLNGSSTGGQHGKDQRAGDARSGRGEREGPQSGNQHAQKKTQATIYSAWLSP